jgi:hypothetical protein
MVYWRCVHPRTDHATFQHTLIVPPPPQRTVCCDNLPRWHSYNHTTSPVIFVHLCFNGNVLSQVTWRRPWHHVQPSLMRSVDVLLHDFRTHLWCPAGSSAECGSLVKLFLDPFMMSNWLSSEMWTFYHMTWNTFIMSNRLSSYRWTCCHMTFWTHLRWPTGCPAKCWKLWHI